MKFLELLIQTFTPVLTNFGSGAYTANDQVGGINTLTDICATTKGTISLQSVTIIDKAKQKAAIDLFFFNDLPVIVSADNAEFELLDSEMLKCIGVVSIAAADYADSKNSAVACKGDLNKLLQAVKGKRALYCIAVTRGTPTYTTIADLSIKLGIVQP